MSFPYLGKLPLVAFGILASFLFACSQGGDSAGDSAAALGTAQNQSPAITVLECGDETFASDLFTSGTIHGQNGWSLTRAQLVGVVENIGGDACRGSGVWRLSNINSFSGYGEQPLSPILAVSAGESHVRSVGGGDTIETSFFIKPVSTVADGSSFTYSDSPSASNRGNYLRFDNVADGDGGFRIVAIDYRDVLETFAGTNTTVSENLSRDSWHHVRIVSQYNDGVRNDTVKIYVNSILAATVHTWEDYFFNHQPPIIAQSRALFRMSIAPSSYGAFSTPSGFYIDDFKQKIYHSLAPDVTLAEYKTGFELN